MINAMDQLLATTIMTVGSSSVQHCLEKGNARLLCRVYVDSMLIRTHAIPWYLYTTVLLVCWECIVQRTIDIDPLLCLLLH